MAQTTLKPKVKPAASKKRPMPDSEDEELTPEEISHKDGSVLSATPPSAKKQKRAPAAKKAGAKPLQENENDISNLDGGAEPKQKKASKSTDQYQKVNITVDSQSKCISVEQMSSSHNLNT